MKCSDVIARLSEYADGEVGEYARAQIGSHLEGCESCRQALADLRAIQTAVHTALAGPVETPNQLDAIMSLLPGDRPSRVFPWRLALAGLAVAAAIAAFVCVRMPPPSAPRRNSVAQVKHHPSSKANKPVRIARQPDGPKRRLVPATSLHSRKPERVHRQTVRHPAHRDGFVYTPTGSRPIKISLVRTEMESSRSERRSRVTMVVACGGREITYEKTLIETSLPPNQDAARIERPPLKTVIAPRNSPALQGS